MLSIVVVVVVDKDSCSIHRMCSVCVQFVPDECTEVADIGDEVYVHYTVNSHCCALIFKSMQSLHRDFDFALCCSFVC